MRIPLVIALGTVALSGCAHKHHTARRVPAAPSPAGRSRSSASRASEAARSTPGGAPDPLFVETGKASWYGHPYHGRTAANGEVYDMEKLTAAHRTLPFDTWVHVVNLTNDKAVDVRITDRGPFIDGRVIDLSHAAAREIGLIGPGVADVRLEIVSVPETASVGRYAVQVGAFRNKDNAERERDRMKAQYGAATIVQWQGRETPLWRVLVGAEKTEDGADELRKRIRKDSPERNGFVVRLDS
jgi:rare lipoprotein A